MYNNSSKNRSKKRSNKRRFFFLPIKDSERTLSDTEKLFFKYLNADMILILGVILLGICIYMNVFSDNFIRILLSVIFLVEGCIKILAFFKKEEIFYFKLSIIYGIISVLLGILALFKVSSLMLFGLWLCYQAIVKIDFTIRLKLFYFRNWHFEALNVFLALFMAIIVLIQPFKNLSDMEVLGSFLILFGVLNETNFFFYKNQSSDFFES